MKALVVFDSFFGNTEQIARAVGTSLGRDLDVEVLRVGDVTAGHLLDVGLLVVGSPTRGFRPSPATSKFVGELPAHSLNGVDVAAFDTRIAVQDTHSRILPPLVKLFGYAARPIADKLVRKGGHQVVPPEGFIVQGTEGPLKPGEIERASAWAAQVVGQVLAARAVPVH